PGGAQRRSGLPGSRRHRRSHQALQRGRSRPARQPGAWRAGRRRPARHGAVGRARRQPGAGGLERDRAGHKRRPGGMNLRPGGVSMLAALHDALDPGENQTPASHAIKYVLVASIAGSVAAAVWDTIPSLPAGLLARLNLISVVTFAVFTIEYVARV